MKLLALLVFAFLLCQGCVLSYDYRSQMTPEQLDRWKTGGWVALGVGAGAVAADDGDTFNTTTNVYNVTSNCTHPAHCE